MGLALKQPRLSVQEYLQLCKAHFIRYWKGYTLPLLAVFVFQTFFRVDVNITESLPDHAFLTVKGWTSGIKRGDYVAFEWQGGGPFPKGFHFVKIVTGMPGDVITMDANRGFWLNAEDEVRGRFLGTAKTRSKKGESLQPGPTGKIPPGRFYVSAPHPDSLDSRYALTGWIAQEHLIGRTFALF